MQKTVRKIIEEDINPYVDQWEAEGQYPAKQVSCYFFLVGHLEGQNTSLTL